MDEDVKEKAKLAFQKAKQLLKAKKAAQQNLKLQSTENVEMKQEKDTVSSLTTNVDNFDLPKLPVDGSLKNVHCILCDKTLKVSSKLKKDIKCFQCSKLSFRCNICSHNFKTESVLNHHKRLIHEKAFAGKSCDLCGQIFRKKSSLTSHINIIHEGRKDFKCDECGKSFTQSIGLKLHIKAIHEGRKDYGCHLCNKVYTTKGHLLVHMKSVHEKCRDFVCEICGMAFSRKDTKKRHVIHVHGSYTQQLHI